MDYNARKDCGARGDMSQNDSTQRFEMKHAGTRRLFEYWSDLRGGRTAPYKSEVTARGIGRTLASNTFILENLGDGGQRFRLAGSQLHDIFGLEVRGMSALSIMETDSRPRFQSLIQTCLKDPSVGIINAIATTREGGAVSVEIIMTPLRSDFDQMNRILGAAHVIDTGGIDLYAAPRQCRITSVSTLPFQGAAQPEISSPLPGFAEDTASFDFQNPTLTAIKGGAQTGDRRQGHLKVVKD